MKNRPLLENCLAFQWDKGNQNKNWAKHRVSPFECEQIFFRSPLIVADDMKHSKEESRLYALGRTDADRLLFIVFTIRHDFIRIISARDMNKKERKIYLHEKENSAV